MKILVVMGILLFCMSLSAFGEYAYEITTERDAQGKCINGRDITADISYTLNPDGTKQVFTDTPDAVGIDDDDKQEWYVGAPGGQYLAFFSFKDVGLMFKPSEKWVQYWIRYHSGGGLFTNWVPMIVVRDKDPKKG